MRTVKVTLNYSASDETPTTASFPSPVALPFRVLDSEGGLLAEGVTRLLTPNTVTLPDVDGPVFVRLTWPSGKTQTKRVNFDDSATVEVVFSDEAIRQSGWSAWAIPRLNERTPLVEKLPSTPLHELDKFGRTWLRLWQFQPTGWVTVPLKPMRQYSDSQAKQIDMQLATGSWLLQLGGVNVVWRFVSLPGGGMCRVFITPRDSSDPRADSLKVIVTSFRSDAETLLEFLSRDSLRAAKSLANFTPLAIRLLSDKVDDPIAAVAGAYFLLRTESFVSVPIRWFKNLSDLYSWIPDAAIVFCVAQLRAGLPTDDSAHSARSLLEEALRRGLPIFAEGLSLLNEAASLLKSPNVDTPGSIYAKVAQLTASQAWAGSAFSFYGETPDAPSTERIFGTPGVSQRNSKRIQRGVTGKFVRQEDSSANDVNLQLPIDSDEDGVGSGAPNFAPSSQGPQNGASTIANSSESMLLFKEIV